MTLQEKLKKYKSLVNKEIGKAKGTISYQDFIDGSPSRGRRNKNRGLWLPYTHFIDYEQTNDNMFDMGDIGGDMGGGIGEQEVPDTETGAETPTETPDTADTPTDTPDTDVETTPETPDTGTETSDAPPVDDETDGDLDLSDVGGDTGSSTPSFGGGMGGFTPSSGSGGGFTPSSPETPATDPSAASNAQPTPQVPPAPVEPSSQITDDRQSEIQVVTQVFVDKMTQVLDKLDTLVDKVSDKEVQTDMGDENDFSFKELDKDVFPFNMKFSNLHNDMAERREDKMRSYSDGDIKNSLLNY